MAFSKSQMRLKMASLASAHTSFSLDLFKRLSADNGTGNVFFSPLSISSALAMVYLGARGNTATEMAQTLHFHEVEDDLHVGFSKLISELNKAGAPYKLSMANRLYGEKSFNFVEQYIAETRKHYQAELELVDFITGAEEARQNINAWVEKQTQEKIKDLLAEGTIDSITRLVLVNAIYFKGNWEKKFNEAATREAPFHLNKNETKPVQMMYLKAKFGLTFIPEVSCQILELPYLGKELSMLIMLPSAIEDDSTGLEKLERELTYGKLMEWTKPEMMDVEEVEVSLPKLKFEETYDLKEVLKSMGMVDAFDSTRSDFSGMSSGSELFLSKVVHKSFVEVNEEGTEAAAATAAVMVLECARIIPHFTADHPFLFFIRHNKSQHILFYGRFCSP
ncbi:leukocyte elastase inhibitor-like isoform X1 [Lepisosteus oculatus]|uniref:leukocyte elastase inhibitor-like isoform X1 n=2 Tax=Lepisosteus oculatus TaxID=7918 RepID=UPI0037139F88